MAKNNGGSKKRIVIFIPEFPVVTQTFIQRDIVELASSETLDISIVSLKRGNAILDTSISSRVHYQRLSLLLALGTVFSVLFNLKTFFSFLKLLDQEEKGSAIANAYLVFKSFAYAKILQGHAPDEIHAHFYSDFSTIAMFAAAMLDVPFSVNAHARDVTEYPHLASKKAEMARFISVCNKNAFDKLISYAGSAASKVHLVHHGVDSTKIFEGQTRRGGDVPKIFMGGTRLTEKKGITYMIEASKQLKDDGIAHNVVVIGPDELSGALQKKVADLNLTDTFEIVGKGLPFEELVTHYFSSEIFVLPNIETDSGDVDGIPNALIEASLAGLAIVTTDAGSNLELIEDEKSGLIVSQRDVSALVAAIRRLIEDPNLRNKLGIVAKSSAEAMFSTKNTVSKLEDLLK